MYMKLWSLALTGIEVEIISKKKKKKKKEQRTNHMRISN